MSKQINIITSTAVPLNIENVDTDQIIPARFLKATSREGFGKNLFRDWRYENDDESKPKFNRTGNAEIGFFTLPSRDDFSALRARLRERLDCVVGEIKSLSPDCGKNY